MELWVAKFAITGQFFTGDCLLPFSFTAVWYRLVPQTTVRCRLVPQATVSCRLAPKAIWYRLVPQTTVRCRLVSQATVSCRLAPQATLVPFSSKGVVYSCHALCSGYVLYSLPCYILVPCYTPFRV